MLLGVEAAYLFYAPGLNEQKYKFYINLFESLI